MPHSTVSGPSSDVSGLLRAWGKGDLQARDDLLPLMYRELRQQAAGFLRHEAAGHTLQPTALVNEVYLKLVGPGDAVSELAIQPTNESRDVITLKMRATAVCKVLN